LCRMSNWNRERYSAARTSRRFNFSVETVEVRFDFLEILTSEE
jgi:hypothetical protein